MRSPHSVHTLPAFPVWSAAFTAEDIVVLGGGGGAGRNGVKNKLKVLRIIPKGDLELISELDLDLGDDAPMSMAAHPSEPAIICGVNSPQTATENLNCRAYKISNNTLSEVSKVATLAPRADAFDINCQKVTAVSPDGTLVATAGEKDFCVLNYPSLSLITARQTLEHEIYDVSFASTSTSVLAATTKSLLLHEIGDSNMTLSETLPLPTLPNSASGLYRAARFHPQDPNIIFSVLNTVPPPRSKKTRGSAGPKAAYIVRWCRKSDGEKEMTWMAGKPKKVGEKNVSCFDISPDGQYLAYGSSDCSIGLLDAQTLSPLLTILKAHELPPTILRFNPKSTYIVSGSADNSARVIVVPVERKGSSWLPLIFILLAVLILIAAISYQAWS